LEPYAARVCWNSKNWVYPTGEAAKIEHQTYTTEMGFGHEEWLFDHQRLVDDWKYGFLQPVNKALANVQRKEIDVRLYTISPHNWYYVGHIRRCEVLTEDTAERARKAYEKRGWLQEMVDQVRRIGGKEEGLQYEQATSLFNVRYRLQDAILYDRQVPVEPEDGVRKLRRYTLVHLHDKLAKVKKDWASRVGTTERLGIGKRQRAGVEPGEIDFAHRYLQDELSDLLVARYGKSAVIKEEGFVDLKVRQGGKVTLIEVKSDSRPRYAIREALGQLLEYAYVCERNGEPVAGLVVAGPGEMEGQAQEYLRHLREERGLPMRYVCFRRGMGKVDL
jgi:hypothetical protein